MTSVQWLLSELEDPFNMFPLESVGSRLAAIVTDSMSHAADRNGWYGVSSKYQTVEDEHDTGVVRLLVGSAFVLAQAAITQTVSIVLAVGGLAPGTLGLPYSDKRALKMQLMNTEAPIHASTSLSEILIIDAVANYFKHHYEWPDDWSRAAVGPQRNTIEAVRQLGFTRESNENLFLAISALGMTTADMSPMGRNIQKWRERLAAVLRSGLPTS